MTATSEKVNKDQLLEFIKKFYEEYKQVPGTGFLAGYYKVTIQTINKKLEELHQEKKIKRTVATHKWSTRKNYSSYELV